MAKRGAIEALEAQEWLEPLADALGEAVGQAYSALGPKGQALKDILHGVWLGHPLHPVLTDVPVGAWTAALVLDALESITGRDELGPGADAAVGLGVVGAVAAALAGVTDWRETDGSARRVGLVHGLLNTSATALYGASLVCRGRGNRGAGRGYAALGYAIAGLSAYLGGHLVYAERVGVNHAEPGEPPADWVAIYRAADLPENQLQRVEVNGMKLVLVQRRSKVYVLNEVCSHLGGPLAEGHLDGDGIVCTWHGSRFAITDGHVMNGPATYPELCLETRVRDGQIEVRAARSERESLP